MKMLQPTTKQFVDAAFSRDHKVFHNGLNDLNIMAVRTRDVEANTFNDWLTCFGFGAYDMLRPEGSEEYACGVTVPCTTDPGQYWRDNPPDRRGVAILLPGQYRGFFEIGKHQGKYEALCQRTQGRYWRVRHDYPDWKGLYQLMLDRSEGLIGSSSNPLPPGITETQEIIGSNLHRASAKRKSTVVERWSAACQVAALYFHFDMIMDMARGQRDMGGGRTFTYTLLMEDYF